MKSLSNKKAVIIICIGIAVAVLLAAVLIRQVGSHPYGKEAGSVITEEEVTDVGDVLRAAGLSNVDLYETWIYEYLEDKDQNYKSDVYSDANGRIAAMMLLDDQIKCKKAGDYKGTRLTADVEKIQSEGTYLFIQENIPEFTTLFGEMKIPQKGIEHALPANWKKHSIKVVNEYASLVSLVFKAQDKDEAYVGHAAVLIDCRKLEGVKYKNYLLVEKLGYNDAFMATELEDPKEMLGIFSGRKEIKKEAGDTRPLVYTDDELLGELKY